MKTDKTNGSGFSNTTVTKNEMDSRYPRVIVMLPIMALFEVMLISIMKHASVTYIAKQAMITMILTGAITLYIQLGADIILTKKFAKLIISMSYLGSIFLLLVIPKPEMFCFWMVGGLIVSMLTDNRLGLLVQFNMAIIMGITLDINFKMILLNLIISVLMSILAEAMRNKSTVIYASLIILSVNVTLSFLINNFIFENVANVNYYYYSLISEFVVIACSFMIALLYQKVSLEPEIEDNQEIILHAAAVVDEIIGEQEENDSEILSEMDLRTSLEVLCNQDNILLKQLKEFSESLYTHSIFIGDLSERAAITIGANELLAKAGGLYHEIGKIAGKQYIEEGLNIAKEYNFPKELTAILKEHNIKYDKPNSVEAAIVMLSDNVVSTIEYIEKTDEHKFTSDKIIDNIFQMRMEKGTFDSSGISLKDYKKLKEFYQSEFNKSKEE